MTYAITVNQGLALTKASLMGNAPAMQTRTVACFVVDTFYFSKMNVAQHSIICCW